MAQDANHVAPTISTHVLDTGRGTPAVGIHVTLYRLAENGKPLRLTQALTDADGRVRDLLERPLIAGDYRLEFRLVNGIGAGGGPGGMDGAGGSGGSDGAGGGPGGRDGAGGGPGGRDGASSTDEDGTSGTDEDGTAPDTDEASFFRRIILDLRVTDVGRSYHIPLLMAPYSMTTYRGS